MTARLIGTVAVEVGEDVSTAYGTSTFDGQRYGVVRLGGAVTLHTSDTSPEALRRLAAAVAELADFREQQLAVVEERAA